MRERCIDNHYTIGVHLYLSPPALDRLEHTPPQRGLAVIGAPSAETPCVFGLNRRHSPTDMFVGCSDLPQVATEVLQSLEYRLHQEPESPGFCHLHFLAQKPDAHAQVQILPIG